MRILETEAVGPRIGKMNRKGAGRVPGSVGADDGIQHRAAIKIDPDSFFVVAGIAMGLLNVENVIAGSRRSERAESNGRRKNP